MNNPTIVFKIKCVMYALQHSDTWNEPMRTLTHARALSLFLWRTNKYLYKYVTFEWSEVYDPITYEPAQTACLHSMRDGRKTLLWESEKKSNQ